MHSQKVISNYLSHFSHLWVADVGSPLPLNGATDGIPKFAGAIWCKCCENFAVFLVIMSVLVFAVLQFVIQQI